jgi:hypothetical protein
MSSRGMGAMNPSKMPSGKKTARRDDTDFTQYKEGGLAKQAATAIAMKEAGKKPKKMADGGATKSTVNAAGNYTKPGLRKRIFNAVKAEATAGTGAGKWSGRKSQVLAKRYKAAGGGYRD